MAQEKSKKKKASAKKAEDTFFVVGIGAGAGSQEAIQAFFHSHLSNVNASFVLHCSSSSHKSMLPHLLAKYVHLPVEEIKDGTLLEPDRIYVMTGDSDFTVEQGEFHFQDKRKAKLKELPLDTFFSSLANEFGPMAVGILLSGNGHDGTLGLTKIKEEGGMAMVQLPQSAKNEEMPQHAIDNGVADHVLAPRELAKELGQYFHHTHLLKNPGQSKDAQNESLLKSILALIKSQTSFDFTNYKYPTLQRRTFRRMALFKIPNLTAYLRFLQENPEEVHALSRDYLIGVTRFFRDGKVFETLQKDVVPEIVRNNQKKKLIKAWVIGCSTGEEAYTLAIIFREYLTLMNKDIEVKIFATDIDETGISVASKGIFSDEIEKDIAPHLVKKYFTREGDFYRILPEIRKMVIFSVHNIFQDPPFYQIDLITCRNMLIYMQPDLQKKVYARIHFSLNLNGYLVLGSNETLGEYQKGFDLVDKKWKIYRNIHISRGIGHDSLSVTEISVPSMPQRSIGSVSVQKVLAESRLSDSLNEALMEHFGVACVYIDETYRILNAVGDFNRYLQLPDKKFSLNLLKMVSQELSVTLGAAVRRANKEQTRVVYEGMRFMEGGVYKNLTIEVRPVNIKEVNTRICCMVLFIEEKQPRIAEGTIELYPDNPNISQRISDLEQELSYTQENLQATIEELETSNEELQSSNEELLAANEELQSTNEELQSVNEELHTVNSEYQDKIKELAQVNDDIDNLLKNTNIGTLFLDLDLKIRKYTPAILDQFSLIPGDIGRPITHIASNIDNVGLIIKETQRVIDTYRPLEMEISSTNGQWYLLRIQPYVSKDKVIKGAVLTFVLITEIKYSNEQLKLKASELQASEEKWQSLVSNATQTVALLDRNNRILAINHLPPRFYEEGRNENEFIGKDYFDTVLPQDKQRVQDIFVRVYQTGIAETTELAMVGPGGEYEASFIPHKSENEIVGLIIIKNDITERKELERELAINSEQMIKQNRDLEEFAYFASHDLKAPVTNLQRLISMVQEEGLEDRNRLLLEKVQQSVEQMYNTIGTLNEVISTKKSLVLEKERVRFDNIFRQTMRSIEQMISTSGATCKIDFSEKPEVWYPPVHLQSIFQNLLTNAIKYSKEGEAPQIEVKSGVKNGYVYLQVKDNGLGLNLKRDGKNLFGLFKRFHNHVEGNGIGLHIIKAIAETYGGSIEVESSPNNGATFTVNLYKENEESRRNISS